MLSPIQSKQRQKRLFQAMQEQQLDAVVVGSRHHVYYLSAHWAGEFHHGGLVLLADGRSWLATANTPGNSAAADCVEAYQANRFSTLRQDQPDLIATGACEQLRRHNVSRVGIDASMVSSQLALRWDKPMQSIEPFLWHMRRVKDVDELEVMRRAVGCCGAMYRRAREIITPGITEIEVYAQLHAAAVAHAGMPLSPPYLGNDYACGQAGGAARGGRAARDGELYILDLGPAVEGYFSDNARVIAVNGRPTDAQFKAWEQVTQCLRIVESLARPGVRCVEIFEAVDEHLKSVGRRGLGHHLGHGVGLQAHEYPHLNPQWDDVLLEGEIVTAEPGLYGTELAGGIRIENQYLVTQNGVTNLLDEPETM